MEYEYHFELAVAGPHDFVPRLWATRRIGELLDRVRVEGESEALVAEIRDLGLAYGLVTPYTVFAIQAQSEGAASFENMQLYSDASGLGRASGFTAVNARMQNQAYQVSVNAHDAVGANVSNQGQRSLAQVGTQNVDLNLLRGQNSEQLNEPITTEWVASKLQVDRNVEFGSDEYFELAQDPAVRPMLQTGRNVVFEYQGQIIWVQDPENDGAHMPELAADKTTAADASRVSHTSESTAVAWYVVLPWVLVGLFLLKHLVGKVLA